MNVENVFRGRLKGPKPKLSQEEKECKRDKLQPVRQRGTNPGCSRQGTLDGGGENICPTNKQEKQANYIQTEPTINEQNINE